jgi:mRNA interferase MazF
MTISFVPSAGDVLMCDFDGFKPPEMTKLRPVIILSPRSRTAFPDTYIVVPTSRTPPASVEGWHCQLKRGSYSCFDQSVPIWAKCDMVTCIAARRLDRIKVAGRYNRVQIRRDDLNRVRQAVLHALGMETWKDAAIIVETTTTVGQTTTELS